MKYFLIQKVRGFRVFCQKSYNLGIYTQCKKLKNFTLDLNSVKVFKLLVYICLKIAGFVLL